MPVSASPLCVTDAGGQTTVCFTGFPTLNEDNAAAMGEALSALIEGPGQPNLVLDLSAVGFLTSVALGKFITFNGRVQARGGRLTLVNLRPTIRKVFSVSRLDRVLNIRETDEIQAA